jgi:protoporphyrin/coproporphyrin ferrochelatase
VRAYLGEFLSDPRVVKLPRWIWMPLLKFIVLKNRPEKSAEKYAAVWTPEGSPLAVNTKRLAQRLAEKTGRQVEYAMRYGEPSIQSVLQAFGSVTPVVIPLYPQYAESTTATVADVLAGRGRMIQHFHAHPGYIGALAAQVQRHWRQHGRAPLVMSFHGLPKRGAAVYEAQCKATAALLAKELGLEKSAWQVTFQSRFGFAEWLQPYTEPTLVAMAQSGTPRVDVFCPGFVCDCLETLEEIGITARAAFLRAGGKELRLLPCLNDSPEWVAALAEISELRAA